MTDAKRPRGIAPKTSVPARGAPDLRVLVADDELEYRALVTETLRDEGYVVAVAADGSEATRVARQVEPHIVFLDLAMPGFSGWDALPYLRSLPARPRIVALSAHSDARSRQRAFELGCDEFVAKPCTVEEICGLVSAFRSRLGPQ